MRYMPMLSAIRRMGILAMLDPMIRRVAGTVMFPNSVKACAMNVGDLHPIATIRMEI